MRWHLGHLGVHLNIDQQATFLHFSLYPTTFLPILHIFQLISSIYLLLSISIVTQILAYLQVISLNMTDTDTERERHGY